MFIKKNFQLECSQNHIIILCIIEIITKKNWETTFLPKWNRINIKTQII